MTVDIKVVRAGQMYRYCEELGLATVPREVTPGLRPVMEVAGVSQDLIDWSSTRREQMALMLERITDTYVKKHKRLPGERGRNGLGWWAAHDTRREKKAPKPLEQLRAWWRASVILRFGKERVAGLLERCQAAGTAIRARVRSVVDTALAAVDVAAIVFTVRRSFARCHVLAEARRHLLETLRGRGFTRGLDDYIADAALSRHSRRLTVPVPGRRAPAPDQVTYTADFAWPHRWWVAGVGGKPPRESSRYERARVASLALQNAIRDARILSGVRDEAPAATTSATGRTDDHNHDQAAPHAVDHPGRDAALTPAQRAAAVQAHQQAAMPEEYLEGRTTDPATWLYTPKNLDRLAATTKAVEARVRIVADGPHPKQPAKDADGPARQQQHHTTQPEQGRGAGQGL